MLRSSTKAKVFVHLFQKVADSKDSVFGHHKLFEKKLDQKLLVELY